jgi:hypothetical protein
MGYRIDSSYDLRPVMFTPDEVEAVMFGLRMAAAFAGPDLLPHTQSALARITLALPEGRRGETENLSQLLRALGAARVDSILVGGVAAAAHGSARLTQDVDVVYRRDADNFERLVAALGKTRPYLRGAHAFGVECRVLDLPTLIATKRAAGRPKDFEAIAELEILRDRDKPR